MSFPNKPCFLVLIFAVLVGIGLIIKLQLVLIAPWNYISFNLKAYKNWSIFTIDHAVNNLPFVKDGYNPEIPLIPMENQEANKTSLLIHTWHVGPLIRGFELTITSALVTQNLKKSKLIIWMDEPWHLSEDPYKRSIVEKYRFTPHGFIEFRLLDVQLLAKQSNSCWKDRPEFMLTKPIIDFCGVTFYADILRLLLLDVYGGFWVDSDSTFIIDLWVIHRKLNDKIVSGRVFGEDGSHWGNNNIIYVSDKKQREILIDISCEFRAQPNKITRTNYTYEELKNLQFQDEWKGYILIIPHTTEGKPIKPLNGWLWNDGTLGLCYELRNFCNYFSLPMKHTDTLWMGNGGLFDFCESLISNYADYVPDVEELLRSTRADVHNITAYWEAQNIADMAVIVHDRKKDCRTFGTEVHGTLKLFNRLINLRLGSDPRLAPIEPLDFLFLDPWMSQSRNAFDAKFSHLTIFIKSKLGNRRMRHRLRSILKKRVLPSYKWHDTLEGASFGLQILFVVELANCIPGVKGREVRRKIGQVIQEAGLYNDIIFVPPTNRNRLTQESPTINRNKTKQNELRRLVFNLTLYEKWGKEIVLNSTKPPTATANLETFEAPNLNIDERDVPLLTFDSWGEREFSGNGFIDQSMELAVMKWSLASESLFIVLINQDDSFINIPQIERIVKNLSDAESILFKTIDMPTFVIALPNFPTTRLDGRLAKWNSSNEIHKSFKYPSVVHKDLIYSVGFQSNLVVSAEQLRSAQDFRGIIVSRNVLPYLLSSENPIKRSSKLMRNSCIDATSPNRTELLLRRDEESKPKTQSFSSSATERLHNCVDGMKHPLNSRIDNFWKRFYYDEFFMSKDMFDFIRITLPIDYNLTTTRLTKSIVENKFLPIINTESKTYECLKTKQFDNENMSNTTTSHLQEIFPGFSSSEYLLISGIPEDCPDVLDVAEFYVHGLLNR